MFCNMNDYQLLSIIGICTISTLPIFIKYYEDYSQQR